MGMVLALTVPSGSQAIVSSPYWNNHSNIIETDGHFRDTLDCLFARCNIGYTLAVPTGMDGEKSENMLYILYVVPTSTFISPFFLMMVKNTTLTRRKTYK
jgi:hypothetical protein